MSQDVFKQACAMMGEMFKETRTRFGMQPFEVAMKAQMPVSRLIEIENGDNFTCEEFMRICIGLNVSPGIQLISAHREPSTLKIPLNLN